MKGLLQFSRCLAILHNGKQINNTKFLNIQPYWCIQELYYHIQSYGPYFLETSLIVMMMILVQKGHQLHIGLLKGVIKIAKVKSEN